MGNTISIPGYTFPLRGTSTQIMRNKSKFWNALFWKKIGWKMCKNIKTSKMKSKTPKKVLFDHRGVPCEFWRFS